MYCENCGNELIEGAKFCSDCGKQSKIVSAENSGNTEMSIFSNVGGDNNTQKSAEQTSCSSKTEFSQGKGDTLFDKIISVFSVIIVIAVLAVAVIVGKWLLGVVFDFLFGKDEETKVGQSNYNLTDYINEGCVYNKFEFFVDGTEYFGFIVDELL